jgi:hypothetical protein
MGSQAMARLANRLQTKMSMWFAGFLCALIPFALFFDALLNHFYRTGGYFWDSGSLAHATTFSTSWPMMAPPILHRGSAIVLETFGIHFHPIFYLTSALHLALPFVPAAAYYSFVQALFPGLLGLSVFIVFARSTNHALAVITALATAFCGPLLVNIGLPHIELAIPSLFLLFLALRSVGHRIGSFIALGLCLSVREDAGLHACLLSYFR